MLGMPDAITALSFDSAVMTFGVWAENKLLERWTDGAPKYTLDDLLRGNEEQYVRARNQRAFDALFAAAHVRSVVVK